MTEKVWKLVDKTKVLETYIQQFSSVYIEGAAASGKSVLINMLMSRHPEVVSFLFCLKKESEEECLKRLQDLCEISNDVYANVEAENIEPLSMELEPSSMERENARWYIFEDVHMASEGMLEAICKFLDHLKPNERVFLTSQKAMPKLFYPYFWERQMDLLPQHMYQLTLNDVRQIIFSLQCDIRPEKIFDLTGGWSGCTEVVLRLVMHQEPGLSDTERITRALKSPIFSDYLKTQCWDTLDADELEILKLAAVLPWINEELCKILLGKDVENLCRQLNHNGYLETSMNQQGYQLATLFKHLSGKYLSDKHQAGDFDLENNYIAQALKWYEEKNDMQALWQCLRGYEDTEGLAVYLNRYMPIWTANQLLKLNVSAIESCADLSNSTYNWYYRALDAYCQGKMSQIGLLREDFKCQEGMQLEVYMNMMWLDPNISLEAWLDLLAAWGDPKHPIRLYHVCGFSLSYLCGIRDLSKLFACSKKEEKQREKVWKTYLDEKCGRIYDMAKLEYYIETCQSDRDISELVKDVQWELHWQDDKESQIVLFTSLLKINLHLQDPTIEAFSEKVYDYLCKIFLDEEKCMIELFREIQLYLSHKPNELSLFLFWTVQDNQMAVDESHLMYLFLRAQAYVHLGQYDLAKGLVDRLYKYDSARGKSRIYTEILFLQAIIAWCKEEKMLAVKYAIETFVYSVNVRYVDLFVVYGANGLNVLEAYDEWQIKHAPETWQRKKKYNYGQVLKMPMADYIQVLMRQIGRFKRHNGIKEVVWEKDHLTMTESIVLQYLEKGYHNDEIAKLMNIRLTTVKTHIYNIYKKLNVKSRVQAVNKGKDMGIV